MNKPTENAAARLRETLDRILSNKWSLPAGAMVAAAGAAILAGQILAWKLDRASLPALPAIPAAQSWAAPSPRRISIGGFVPQAAQPVPSLPAPPVAGTGGTKSALPVDLLGTFVGGPKKAAMSIAIVQLSTGSREVEVLKIGEKWKDMELLEVERGRIWVKNLTTGAREFISNDALLAPSAGARLPAAARPASSTFSGGEQVTVSRSEINRTINNNTNIIFSWVDVQPHAVAGRVEGFKLANIKPRGKPFFDKLTFLEGDIVKRVNGVKMDSVDKAVGLWSSIHGKDRVSFTVERQGVDKEITIVFKD